MRIVCRVEPVSVCRKKDRDDKTGGKAIVGLSRLF